MLKCSISFICRRNGTASNVYNDQQNEQIKQLIKAYTDVFNEQLGLSTKWRDQINFLPQSQPHNAQPFRYAPARRQIIEENSKGMSDQGIISPSESPWASLVILVPKNDGSLRFYIVRENWMRSRFGMHNPFQEYMIHWMHYNNQNSCQRSTCDRDIGKYKWTRNQKKKIRSSHTQACLNSMWCILN